MPPNAPAWLSFEVVATNPPVKLDRKRQEDVRQLKPNVWQAQEEMSHAEDLKHKDEQSIHVEGNM